MGPVERALRAALAAPEGIARDGASVRFGGTARAIFNRLVSQGIVEERAGRWHLKQWKPDPEAAKRQREDADRRAALYRQSEAERQDILEKQRKRDEERREAERLSNILCAGLRAYSPAEQRLVLVERTAALRESRGGAA